MNKAPTFASMQNGFYCMHISTSRGVHYHSLHLRPTHEETINRIHSKSAIMSSIASTCTSTALDAQGTRQNFQEGPKPFNKRSTKSDPVEATSAKSRKLSHWDTAPRRVSVDTPAKALASALKRRHESLSLSSKSSHLIAQHSSQT